jgi:hypothetical protein
LIGNSHSIIFPSEETVTDQEASSVQRDSQIGNGNFSLKYFIFSASVIFSIFFISSSEINVPVQLIIEKVAHVQMLSFPLHSDKSFFEAFFVSKTLQPDVTVIPHIAQVSSVLLRFTFLGDLVKSAETIVELIKRVIITPVVIIFFIK